MVEPGAVITELLSRVEVRGERIVAEMTREQRGRYASLVQAVISEAKASIPGGAAPEEAARVIADAIASGRARHTVGRGTAMIVRLTRLLPDHLLDDLLARNLKPHLPSTASNG